MTTSHSPEPRVTPEPRILHHVFGPAPGPTVISVVALHGNERAGIAAVRRVADQVPALERGEWMALTGNRTATAMGVRFLDRDLNRRWSDASRASTGAAEDREQHELREALDAAFARARGPVYLIDLHTTSGPGNPFTVFADTLRCRDAAHALPIPMILGLDEHLDGTLVDYVAGLGHAAVAVEGGAHTDPDAPATLEAAVLLTLHATRLLDPLTHSPESSRTRLRRDAHSIPQVLEVRHRHAVAAGDAFHMHAGFASFDQVRAGQLLARDRRGEIHAPMSGHLLMPLYQAQGDDGFFVVRAVWRGWLAMSRVLRNAGGDRIVPYLPGVRRTADPGVYLVDRRIARWGALEVMHLLGYRREDDEGRVLRVRRRKHDPL
jgi:succinylglutamate desuccinylase